MIVQDLLRNFSCFPDSIRSPAKLQPRHRRRSTDRALTSPRKEWAETRFLLYRLRTLRLFGGCTSFNSFLPVHFVSAWSQKVYKYRNALWDSFENFARATSYFRFIQKYYKSKITSSFPNFDHRTLWQMSHNSRWYHFEIDTVLREEVIIDFRLAPLASDCKRLPRALKKALFISRKAKHASLLWGMLVICRFPGLMMPFHHQTDKNISSKKKKTS